MRRPDINQLRERLARVDAVPRLSDAERDRRWAGVRRIMAERDVVCLVVHGNRHATVEHYLANELPAESTILFPAGGEPVGLLPSAQLAPELLHAAERGEEGWVRDWRFRRDPAAVAAVLEEIGCARGRLGVVGMTAGPHFSPDGYLQYADVTRLQAGLPEAALVEMWPPIAAFMAVRSAEEQTLFRRAADMCEVACHAFWDASRPGATEADVVAETVYAVQRCGGALFGINIASGRANPRWYLPPWQQRVQAPRVLHDGDVVQGELSATVGGIQAFAQPAVGLGDIGPKNRACAQLASEAYEMGLLAIRPGVTWRDASDLIDGPVKKAGFWKLTPSLLSLNPLEYVNDISFGLRQMPGAERFRDVWENEMRHGAALMRPGMTLQLQPNACTGRHRVNIGGNVLVTENGCEALNWASSELRCV